MYCPWCWGWGQSCDCLCWRCGHLKHDKPCKGSNGTNRPCKCQSSAKRKKGA